MRNGLYPKLAWQNIRQNRRFFVPYLLALIGLSAAFYVMSALVLDPGVDSMRGAEYVKVMMGMGMFISVFPAGSGCGRGRRHRGGGIGTAAQAPFPELFMEEEGHGLDGGLQQAERQRSPEVAGHGIGHGRRHRDVDDVVAGGFHQRVAVVVQGLADAGHGAFLGAFLVMRLHARCGQ